MEYNKEITKIHNEFETAGKRLLTESKEILDRCNKKEIAKGKRLAAAGFVNTAQAKEVESKVIEADNAQEVADTVNGYYLRYPNNKFITREQVEEICNKYGLICAPLNRYTGFVPDKKLKLIEKFAILEEDEVSHEIRVIESWGDITDVYPSSEDGGRNLHKIIKKKWISYDDKNLEILSEDPFSYEINGDIEYIEKIEEKGNQDKVICAPEKDMDTSGLKKDGVFHIKTRIRQVPDPVVLQPIEGGYLVITAWGDEASDPIVVNEKHN